MSSTSEAIKVSTSEITSGDNLINISLSPGQPDVLQLTPLQARALAMDLIKAVHQADVRASLQKNTYQRRAEPEVQNHGSVPSWA
jgi:hypothetical protein